LWRHIVLCTQFTLLNILSAALFLLHLCAVCHAILQLIFTLLLIFAPTIMMGWFFPYSQLQFSYFLQLIRQVVKIRFLLFIPWIRNWINKLSSHFRNSQQNEIDNSFILNHFRPLKSNGLLPLGCVWYDETEKCACTSERAQKSPENRKQLLSRAMSYLNDIAIFLKKNYIQIHAIYFLSMCALSQCEFQWMK
jgi:hypothetical protein